LMAAAVLFGGVQLFHGGSGGGANEPTPPSGNYRLVANGDAKRPARSSAALRFRTVCRC
jgi:hypothetical protein